MATFSPAFTAIISADLTSVAASYPALDWAWCAATSGTGDTVLDAVEFVGTIPEATPNTNGLRVVIRLEPDDGDDPASLDYSTLTSRQEADYAPNLNTPTSTIVRTIDHPAPDSTTQATLVSMATVLAYVHGITDLFGA